jgi:hypothetical protein
MRGQGAEVVPGARFQLPKMLFPKFNGEYPRRLWKDQCMDYFVMFNHPFGSQQQLYMRLEGNAAHWYQAYKLRHPVPD